MTPPQPTPHNERVEEGLRAVSNLVAEAILTSYPEDLFPTPTDITPFKNAGMAYAMRVMSKSIGSIAKSAIEDFLQTYTAECEARGREHALTEVHTKLLSVEAQLSKMGQGADDYFMGIDDAAKIIKDTLTPPTV